MKETKEEKEKAKAKSIKARKKESTTDSKKNKPVAKKVNSRSVKSNNKTSNISKVANLKQVQSIGSKSFSEYYDLPYRYNQTVIKILAQTPHALFIYWDISDSDRKEMTDKYGDNFFYETKPVLLVHNKTLNSSFEIEVDDFTNSWYLRTPTSNCVFEIELGRKKITANETIKFENNSNIMHITKSNTLESPNDHILKNQLSSVYFKNVKTNELEKRDVSNYKINNIYNLIELYNDENGYESNPSSGFKIS
ncbi:MAG: DUF4912 domain-containing protein [Clostridia bacterium]|nr:DUF4912 domain-containing protein [Clostridia bacterium]